MFFTIYQSTKQQNIILYESIILSLFVSCCFVEYLIVIISNNVQNSNNADIPWFIKNFLSQCMLKIKEAQIKPLDTNFSEKFKDFLMNFKIFEIFKIFELHNTAFLIWAFFTHSLSFNRSKTKIIIDHIISTCFLILLGLMRYFTFLKTDCHFLIYPFLLSRLKMIFLQIITFKKTLNYFDVSVKTKFLLFLLSFSLSLIQDTNYYFIKAFFFVFGFIEMYIIVFICHFKLKGFGWNLIILLFGFIGVLYGIGMFIIHFL